MKIWSAKCDVRVFSEKMKKASIHRETEYVVFMKSNIFASSQRPRARAHNPDAIDENFRCNTVDLPHRGILVGFIFLSSKPHRHRPEPPEGASSEGCSPADFANLSYCLHPANAMF